MKHAYYEFDVVTLKERTAYLRASLPRRVKLCYAVKANPFITGVVKDSVERVELCSPGEVRIAQELGVSPKKMVVSGVYKAPEDIEKLVADTEFSGILTAESVRQYRLFCSLAEKYDRDLNVLLRLTNGSQFGMDRKSIEDAVSERELCPHIKLRGIQFFSGTQKFMTGKYDREIKALDEFLCHLKDNHGFDAEELEYGPGFPAAYFMNDDFDEPALLEAFSEMLESMKFGPKITLELGRSIAASCGRYFTPVVDMKENRQQNYLLVDGGMHHLVYFGQHMAMKQPVMSVVGKTEIDPDITWTVCGSLCSMNDIIVKQVCLPKMQIGDLLCFENTGAYSMTEGISLFLSRDLPKVYLRLEDGKRICVRETFETAGLNTPKY